MALRRERFAFIDVLELMLRFFKPEPSRMRPADRMVAHTGYLVFGRPVLIDPARANRALLRETGFLSETEPDEAPAPAEDEVVEEFSDEPVVEDVQIPDEDFNEGNEDV